MFIIFAIAVPLLYWVYSVDAEQRACYRIEGFDLDGMRSRQPARDSGPHEVMFSFNGSEYMTPRKMLKHLKSLGLLN